MKFYGRAVQVAEQIVSAFANGQIPNALATIYIQYDGSKPQHQWSLLNQLSVLITGCTDARGYKQWQAVGRQVRKGASAQGAILVPLMRKDDDENPILYGFRGVPVFDVAQTEGEPLPEVAQWQSFIDGLPLIQVAQQWQIPVQTYTGQGSGSKGKYVTQGNGAHLILLGVTNENTWLHELMHAADDRLGNLTESGQHWRSETVAQLGASTLAHMIGRQDVADEGKTYHYIQQYADTADRTVTQACFEVIDRTAKAIQLILDTAEEATT